jgi:hypothetical protein
MVSTRRRLAATVDGRSLTPGDPAYDQARTLCSGGVDQRPAAIVRPTDPSDVAR